MKMIQTPHAPSAIGPYSQAVYAGHTLYVSGQLPINPVTNEIPQTIEEQTRQVLLNLVAVVEAAGLQKTDIVRCGVFLTNLEDFAKMNAVYAEIFGTHTPARAAVEVSRLPKDVSVEIDAIAVSVRSE